jgi:CO/xanthine dehydrogenase Mo-binding subunit
LESDQVRLIQPHVGGAFGGKDDVVYECAAQAAKLALMTGRPVRLTLDREESIAASYKRDPMTTRVRLGAAADGTLRAARLEAHIDSGAYASMAPFASWRAAVHLAGPYRYHAVDVDAHVVYTNNCYTGAFRGFGNAQAMACIEQAVDEIAESVEIDPIEFRLRNCLRSGDLAPTGELIEEAAGLAESLELVREQSDWKRKRQEFPALNAGSEVARGIGVAAYFHGCSLGAEGDDHATGTLRVEADGSLTLTSGLTDYGPGSRTVYTLIAAETLGVNPGRISMPRPDTFSAVESGPTVASRATIVGGNATRVTAARLGRLLTEAAADALDCSVDQIDRQGEDFVSPTGRVLGFDQVVAHARAMGLELATSGRWESPPIKWDFDAGIGEPYFAYSFGAQVIEVTVDTVSGKVDAVGVWAAHDGGQVIFPQGAFGQMYGGIAQGLGYGILERVEFNRGRIRNDNFDEYLIPTAADVPEMQATFLTRTFDEGPYGAKNMAEPPLLPVAPAVANAVHHATGRRIRHLPASLERVLLGHELSR